MLLETRATTLGPHRDSNKKDANIPRHLCLHVLMQSQPLLSALAHLILERPGYMQNGPEDVTAPTKVLSPEPSNVSPIRPHFIFPDYHQGCSIPDPTHSAHSRWALLSEATVPPPLRNPLSLQNGPGPPDFCIQDSDILVIF